MRTEHLHRLTDLFRSSFSDESITLSPATTADDIDGWDSVAHVTLMFAIEDEFGVQFAGNELGEFRDIADLLGYLDAHATQ